MFELVRISKFGEGRPELYTRTYITSSLTYWLAKCLFAKLVRKATFQKQIFSKIQGVPTKKANFTIYKKLDYEKPHYSTFEKNRFFSFVVRFLQIQLTNIRSVNCFSLQQMIIFCIENYKLLSFDGLVLLMEIPNHISFHLWLPS